MSEGEGLEMRFADRSTQSFNAIVRMPGQDGIALAGAAGSSPPIAWLLRLDRRGLRRWEHDDEEAGIEDALSGALEGSVNESLAVYPDGGLAAVGTVGIHRDAVPRGFVRRFTPDGAVAWERRFGNGTAGSEVSACAALADGGAVVSGHDWQRQVSNCVVRLTAAGEVVWDVRLGDNDAWPRSVSVYAEGDLLVTGYARSRSGALQACVARLNQAGEAVFNWVWTDEPEESGFSAGMPGLDGTAVLAGWAAVDGDRHSRDALVMLIDRAGKPIWRLRLPGWPKGNDEGPEQTEVTGVALVADGIFLSGWRNRPRQGSRRAWAAKVGLNGVPIWQDCFGAEFNGLFKAVVPLDDGSALFAGSTQEAGSKSEAWLARVDAAGTLRDDPRAEPQTGVPLP